MFDVSGKVSRFQTIVTCLDNLKNLETSRWQVRLR